MNHVIAQGAPNSLIRNFQVNPSHGIDLLNAAKAVVSDMRHPKNAGSFLEYSAWVAVLESAIAKAEGKA